MSVKKYVSCHKYMIGGFVAFILFFTGYLCFRYESRKQQYHSIYENSIINSVGTASQYGKMSVKLTLQDNQEYIFTPQNMIPSDFERYTMNMGFTVEKRANSDTIFLIKGNTIKICIIQKP